VLKFISVIVVIGVVVVVFVEINVVAVVRIAQSFGRNFRQ
jgi:hypothetical protein